jgi:GNAT superfamily N-acetyltransferase
MSEQVFCAKNLVKFGMIDGHFIRNPTVQTTPAKTFTRSDLKIRPALPTDRAALEAIAAQIWDGDDYLPLVLDEWFNDPYDGFFVAALQDQVIGVAKLTRFAEDEWWMEGLRVDPAYQGQGLARILHHFMLNQVRQIGKGIVRFSTSGENAPIHTLAEETGFELVSRYGFYEAEPVNEPVQHVRKLGPDDLAQVRAWLDQSAYYQQSQRSLERDWCYFFITDARLAEWLQAGRVYGFGTPITGIVMINLPENERWPEADVFKIGYLDADADSLVPLAMDLRRMAAALQRKYLHLKPLNIPERIAALQQAGYTQGWDNEAHLFSRDVSLTTNADVRVEEIPPVNS